MNLTLINNTVKARAIDMLSRIEIGAGPVYQVSITEADLRSIEQNARLHAALSDIARQVEWHGQRLSLEVWKRLCVAAYMREQRKSPLLVPALDGQGVDIIYERTSRMSKRTISELMEWVYAFGSEQGVVWSERARAEHADD